MSRELLANATPRPWTHSYGSMTEVWGHVFSGGVTYDEADAHLIVAAVNEYEALLGIATLADNWMRMGASDNPAPIRSLGEIAIDFKNALARLDAIRSA